MKTTAFLGGTFDPIHRGHIQIAEAAIARLPIEKLYFTPCSQTPHHRDTPIASKEDRLAMIRLAISDQINEWTPASAGVTVRDAGVMVRDAGVTVRDAGVTVRDAGVTVRDAAVEVETYEIELPSFSYTINTLKHFRNIMPETSLAWILGADAFRSFDTWYEFATILDYAHLIIATRPGQDLQCLPSAVQQLLETYETNNPELLATEENGRIFILPDCDFAISSTEIKRKLASGKDCSTLLSNHVYTYIKQHNIY